MTLSIPLVKADTELRRLLAQLDTRSRDSENSADNSQDRADRLLASVVWARIAEPGDRTAGELREILGSFELLQLLSSGTSAKKIALAVADRTNVEAQQSTISAGVKRWLPRLDRSATLEDLKLSVQSGFSVLIPGDTLWPQRLDDLWHSAPAALWVRGNPSLLTTRSLAIVGARAATGYGEHITSEIADGVGRSGYTVVSGAAFGIDATAHRTALAIEASTIAVVAGGLDRPYPEAHRQLLDRIATEGTVCSEMVPGSSPTRWRFLQRNRLIAALTDATLVTEAGIRSGSINTAGHAAELGRSLGAVPGPVTSAASMGCHKLLREYGATLVTNTADALELLGATRTLASEGTALLPEGDRQPELHRRLLDALPLRGTRTLPEAARRAGLSIDEARDTMAELELLGHVHRHETPAVEEVSWRLRQRE